MWEGYTEEGDVAMWEEYCSEGGSHGRRVWLCRRSIAVRVEVMGQECGYVGV